MFVSDGVSHRLFVVDVQLAPKIVNTEAYQQLSWTIKGKHNLIFTVSCNPLLYEIKGLFLLGCLMHCKS